MIAVKIPIGISIEMTTREILSINNKKLAPKLNEAGINILLSGPTTILAMWGIIMPIHPIIPLIDTAAEVNKVQAAIIINLTLEGFKPKD